MYKFKCKLREEGNPSQTHKMEHYPPAEGLKLGDWSTLSPDERAEIADIYMNKSTSNTFRSEDIERSSSKRP